MRRFIDLLVGVSAVLLLSPIMLITALAVAIDSPGNPLFGGWRAGKHGVPFRMWKFRTMVRDAARLGPITGRNDSRITRLGRVLRKSKLDELPQFINLLLGDMTLVGPRPESLDIVANYTPAQRAVLTVKPGITGAVQLDSREESESLPADCDPQKYYLNHLMNRKIQLDLQYLKVQSPITDLQIVLRTAAYVVRACFTVTKIAD